MAPELKSVNCTVCDNLFTQKQPNHKYCSKDCSYIANMGHSRMEEVEKACETCGEVFKTDGQTHSKKYCNIKCQPSYQKQRSKAVLSHEPHDLVCALETCNNKFEVRASNPTQIFCCKEHSSQHHSQKITRKEKITKVFTCEWCKETFEKTNYEANLKQVRFCSSKCNYKSTRARAKSAPNYSSKISLTKKGKVTNQDSVKLGLPDYRFGDPTYCSYCGDSLIGVESGVDHCMPRSFFLDVGVKGSNARGLTTPSCHKCNSLLSDKIFDTFEDRRRHLTDIYQTVIDRYFNEENTWTEEELDEHDYDYPLRKLIEQKIWNRYVLFDKVNWPYSAEYREMLGSVEFDIKYTDEFNEAQLPFMRRFFNVEIREKA